MKREELEDALHAVARLTGEEELWLFGSQSVHAHTADPPPEVLISMECDVALPRAGSNASALLAELGKNSDYHLQRGYFVDAIDTGIVLLPAGWEARRRLWTLDRLRVLCLEINDLVISKLNAGRIKDYEFINAVLRLRLADENEITRRIMTFPDPHQQAVLLARLQISREGLP